MPTQTEAPPWRADLALLGITAIWGGTFVTVKDALTQADSFTFLTLRFLLGAGSAALLARGALLDLRVWRRGGVLGVLLFGGYALQTVGLESTSPSRSAFITGLTVLFVPFASALINRLPPRQATEPLRRAALVSVLIAAVGLWQLTGVDLSQPFSQGDLLTLGCAVVYGFHIAAMGRLGVGVSPTALVVVQMLVTCVLSAVARGFVTTRFTPSSSLLVGVLITGLLASTCALSVQVWAQARTSAVRAAVIYALEPVFAVAYLAALGRGWPDAHELLGGALVIVAVVIAEFGRAESATAV